MTERDPRLEVFAAASESPRVAEVARRFDETAVVIKTDAAHAVLALSVANLAARLWPNTRLEGPPVAVSVAPFGDGVLRDVARTLISKVRLSMARAPTQTITVGLGLLSDEADLFATSDAWSLRVSPEPIASLAGGRGPATTAAAALIAAEIFRRVLPEMAGLRLSQEFAWNLVNYRREVTASPPFEAADAACFGAGSVGSSLVLALLVADARGRLVMVDDDILQPRNRLRYPLWIAPARGRKVDWIAGVCHGQRLTITPRHELAQAYGSSLDHPPTLAVAAVDTVDGRAAVADILACETLNAGVNGLQLHVARHRFADGLACVYCGYVDASPAASELETYVSLTGLPAERVEHLLRGERLSEADVEAMVVSRRLGEDALELVGGRLMDVARARLYAATAIPSMNRVGVAAPFVSAMAGAVLAAELLKSKDRVLDRRVDIDLSGWPTGFVSRPRQDPTHRCLCWSGLRQRAYDAAWSKRD